MEDHEFPWIVTDGMEQTCTRCGEQWDVDDWIEMVSTHSKCEEK